MLDVLVDNLVVASPVKDEDWYMESACDRDLVAGLQIVVVRRRRAKEILRGRHQVVVQLVGLPFQFVQLLMRSLPQEAHLLDVHCAELSAAGREKD